MTLPNNTPLYRYVCIDIPPDEWTTDFKNPEYNHKTKGVKNQIGSFFFYENEETAKKVASCVASRLNCEKVTITSCHTLNDLNLFDLRCEGDTIKTLEKLYDAGINVLTDDYTKHNGEKFSNIKECYSHYCEVKNYDPIIICLIVEKIKAFFRIGNHSALGQFLTDFDNGSIFKDELLKNGYDGYIFDEEQSSSNICLFSSDNLSKPIHLGIRV